MTKTSMNTLSDNQIAFVNYYISAGAQWSQAVEMYKLAFGEEAGHLQESSIATYCKRILATPLAKEIISRHDSSNLIVTKTLMNRLLDVTEKINDKELSHKERTDYITHERILAKQLNDSIRKKVEVNKTGKEGSGFTFNLITPEKCGHCGRPMNKVSSTKGEAKVRAAMEEVDPFE